MSNHNTFNSKAWPIYASSEDNDNGNKKRRALPLSMEGSRIKREIDQRSVSNQESKRSKHHFDLTLDIYEDSQTWSSSDSNNFSDSQGNWKHLIGSVLKGAGHRDQSVAKKPAITHARPSSTAPSSSSAVQNQQVAEWLAQQIRSSQSNPVPVAAAAAAAPSTGKQDNSLQLLMDTLASGVMETKPSPTTKPEPSYQNLLSWDLLLQLLAQQQNPTSSGQSFNTENNLSQNFKTEQVAVPLQQFPAPSQQVAVPPQQYQIPNQPLAAPPQQCQVQSQPQDTSNLNFLLCSLLGVQGTNNQSSSTMTSSTPPSSNNQSPLPGSQNEPNTDQSGTELLKSIHDLLQGSHGSSTNCSKGNVNSGDLQQMLQMLPSQQPAQQQLAQQQQASLQAPVSTSPAGTNTQQIVQVLLSQLSSTSTNETNPSNNYAPVAPVPPREDLMMQQQQRQGMDSDWLLQRFLQQQRQPSPPNQATVPIQQNFLQQTFQTMQQQNNVKSSTSPTQPGRSDSYVSQQPGQSTGSTDAVFSLFSRLSPLSDSKPSSTGTTEKWTVTDDDSNHFQMEYHKDSERLSPYQIFIRQQLEYFVSDRDDSGVCVQGRKKRGRLGQVGIRCKHCAHFPYRLRGRGSCYYPAKLSGIYQASQNMASNHLLEFCSCIPDDIREDLRRLRSSRQDSAAGAGKQYWADVAKQIGVFEEEEVDGLRLQGYNPPKQEPLKEEEDEGSNFGTAV